jgi:hypothetical protein
MEFVGMSKVIELSKRFNHRWKTDPAFEKGFDYDNPNYAGVDDDLKWAIPMMEAQKTPEAIQKAQTMKAQAIREVEEERKSKLRSQLRIV